MDDERVPVWIIILVCVFLFAIFIAIAPSVNLEDSPPPFAITDCIIPAKETHTKYFYTDGMPCIMVYDRDGVERFTCNWEMWEGEGG